MTQVDFLFDFSSPNAYLVHKMIPGIEDRTGAEFVYVPCLLGGIFKATNNQPPLQANAHIPSKVNYDQMEFFRFIKKNKLDAFNFNPNFPLRTVFLMRAAIVEAQKGNLRKFVDAGMKLAWEDRVNVSDPETAAAALSKLGFDGAALLEATQAADVKDALFENTDAAIKRGAFGMPTFYVEDQMFFGKDRLRELEEEILARM